ncbi:MAG: hypothetical protein ACXVAX_08780, partial [Pseudobdellovibrio sp.]
MRLGILIFFISMTAFSLETGFNIAWWQYHYSNQWLDSSFDTSDVLRQFDLVKQSKASRIRLWLFEGQSLTNFNLDSNGQPLSIKSDFLKNLKYALAQAQNRNLKVTLTLIDANAFCPNKKPEGTELNARYFWYNVINKKYDARERFEALILPQLLKELKDFSNVDQLELANEINALVACDMTSNSWYTIGDLQCSFRDQVKKYSYADSTSSLGWSGADRIILSNSLYSGCVDYYDLHVYDDNGSIPSCGDFLKLSNSKRLQLGEFGQLSQQTDDALQAKATQNFLMNAPFCGFSSAIAWRLDDPQIDKNPNGRFSFIRAGKPRPA